MWNLPFDATEELPFKKKASIRSCAIALRETSYKAVLELYYPGSEHMASDLPRECTNPEDHGN